MEIRNREQQIPFTTKDGSTIRSLLDASNAPVRNQSLAEASLPAGAEIERHYHKVSEEFYYLTRGRGLMEIDGVEREVSSGDAILIRTWPCLRSFPATTATMQSPTWKNTSPEKSTNPSHEKSCPQSLHHRCPLSAPRPVER
jgi:hypothetical protein